MPLDGDNVEGIVGTAVGAAVGLAAVKMTTDLIGGMADGPRKKKCRQCGKIKRNCKCKANVDYGGDLFRMDSWRNL